MSIIDKNRSILHLSGIVVFLATTAVCAYAIWAAANSGFVGASLIASYSLMLTPLMPFIAALNPTIFSGFMIVGGLGIAAAVALGHSHKVSPDNVRNEMMEEQSSPVGPTVVSNANMKTKQGTKKQGRH